MNEKPVLSIFRSRAIPFALAVLVACNGDVVLPSQGEPKTVSIAGGDGQQGVVAAPLTDSLAVTVKDTRGRAVVGQALAVNLISGGSVEPAGLRTDDKGRVAFRWILGPGAGPQSLEVGVGDSGKISPKAAFSAQAGPESATVLEIVAGDDQVAEAGQALADSLSVKVSDQYGNPVPGAGVTWTPAAGGVDPGHAVADANGFAATAWTLGGTAGAQSTVAELDPAPGTTADFSATATPGPPPVLLIVTQPSANAQNGVPFATQPVIQVADANGVAEALPGISVTAAVASGGGALSGTTTVATDAAGEARFTDLAISGSAGPRTLLFAAANYLTATSHVITLSPRAPSPSLSTIAANPTMLTAGVGSSLITVILRDSAGGPIAGLAVTLSASGGGNTVVQPSSLTDATGKAVGSFASTVAELKQISASVGPVTLDDVAPISVVPGQPDPATTDADVPNGRRLRTTEITITTRDALSNPLTSGGFAADFTVTVTGTNNPLFPLTVTDNGDGTYSASYQPGLFKGTDTITITLDGVQIKGSPYVSKVN